MGGSVGWNRGLELRRNRVASIRPDGVRDVADQHQPGVVAIESLLVAVRGREPGRNPDGAERSRQVATAGQDIVRVPLSHSWLADGKDPWRHVFVWDPVGPEVADADVVSHALRSVTAARRTAISFLYPF